MQISLKKTILKCLAEEMCLQKRDLRKDCFIHKRRKGGAVSLRDAMEEGTKFIMRWFGKTQIKWTMHHYSA